MKKGLRIATLVLALLMTFSMLSGISFATNADKEITLTDTAEIFSDVVSTKWYKEAVDYAYTYNLFQGTSDTTFEPDSPMNRAMFVTVLARLDGADTSNNVFTKFNDIPTGKWYTGNVKWASDNQIVNGITEKTFEPMSSITREQMCTMLVRYANYKGIVLEEKVDKLTFADDSKIKSYAKESVYTCQMAGLVNGMTATTFEPSGTATRAQVAKILMGFHKDYIYVAPEQDDIPTFEPTTPEEHMNAILNENGKPNTSYLPSFNVDSTQFIKAGTKLSDFAGKTLSFFTAETKPTWSYRNEKGETIDEWGWFKQLKSELNLNIKYTIKQRSSSFEAALQYMRAGKQCDIICGNRSVYPHVLNLSRNITELIDKDAPSPGVNKTAMNLAKWSNSPRIIAPVGSVNVLWYNETLSKELNLTDPHTLWKNGNWNWDTFKRYLTSAPDKNNNGEKLTAFVQWRDDGYAVWPSTNGAPLFRIDNNSAVTTLINNWDNPNTMDAWKFITGVANSINYSYSETEYLDLYYGKTLMSTSMYDIIYRDTEYSKNIKLNWVPFPKSTGRYGQEICQFSGNAMMLPKKTVKEENVNIALKFMELWATRYSESIFDNLSVFEYHNFSYNERVEFYNYTNSNLSFSISMGNLYAMGGVTPNFKSCFYGNPSYDVSVEAPKISDDIQRFVMDTLTFGL